jgi:hypothetical protein
MSCSRWSLAPIHNVTRHQTPLHVLILGPFIVAKKCEAGLRNASTDQFQPCDVSLIQKPLEKRICNLQPDTNEDESLFINKYTLRDNGDDMRPLRACAGSHQLGSIDESTMNNTFTQNHQDPLAISLEPGEVAVRPELRRHSLQQRILTRFYHAKRGFEDK